MRNYETKPLAAATRLDSELQRALEDIAWTREKLPEAIHRLLTDCAGPSASFGESVSGSRDFAGPMIRAIQRPDEIARKKQKLYDTIRAIAAMSQLARTIALEACAISQDEADALLAESTGGSCKVCSIPVAGTRDDRLRGGRCQPCNMYFREHGVECPKEIWEARPPKRRKVKAS